MRTLEDLSRNELESLAAALAEAEKRKLPWQPPTQPRRAEPPAGVAHWATGFIPHAPTAKQGIALGLNDTLELLYGGAAGGGKSDYLLMAALQYVDVPNYAALLLRRTYSDLALPGALMDRAFEWLSPTAAHWNAEEKTWRFPSGATITFGYLEAEKDKFRYQSSEFQFVGFDELTQFSELQYSYLFSRLRRLAGADVPLRMRAATNPDGDGLEWVRARFVPDAYVESLDLAKFDAVWRRDGRAFVPARLEDNPHIDQAAYTESLTHLDAVTEARLRWGDWLAVLQGELIRSEWFGDDKYLPFLPDGARWNVRAWDLALKDKQVVPDGKRKTDPDFHASVCGCIFGQDLLLGRPLIWRSDWSDAVDKLAVVMAEEATIRHGTGRGSHETAAVQALLRRGYKLAQYPETQDKVSRSQVWIDRAKHGRVKFVGTRQEWAAFTYWWWRFPRGAHDDPVDATSGVAEMLGLVLEYRKPPPSIKPYDYRKAYE